MNGKRPFRIICLLAGIMLINLVLFGQDMKALIIDGQNNHAHWPKTTIMMKSYLENTDLFAVDVYRTAHTWNGEEYLDEFSKSLNLTSQPLDEPKSDPNFSPSFDEYDVVISNLGWMAAPWPAETKKAFENYVRQGGGLVIVHAANNSFPDWAEYNEMIGLGGWGNRNEKDGPYVYFSHDNKLVRDSTPGPGGSHGPQHEFQVVIRDNSHPITAGLPEIWLHVKDELYDRLRGPGKNMGVLATAFSSEEMKGSGRHEPMLITTTFGEGRVFHTPMGHADYSMECVGFITCLLRGVEWAATGQVTQRSIPEDFPTATQTSNRVFKASNNDK